jgi:hypothetical protein
MADAKGAAWSHQTTRAQAGALKEVGLTPQDCRRSNDRRRHFFMREENCKA